MICWGHVSKMYRWRCWRRRCGQTLCKKELLFRYWKCQKTKSVVAYNDRLKRDTYHFIWHIEVIEVNNISISIDPTSVGDCLLSSSGPNCLVWSLQVVMFMIRQWGSTDGAFAALNTQPDNMLNHKEWQFRCTFLGKEMSVWPVSWKDECLSVPRVRNLQSIW